MLKVMKCVFPVSRPSRCFRGDTPHPSRCRRFRYPACSPTLFSALSLIATPPQPTQSTTTTPPLTSAGLATRFQSQNPLNTLSAIVFAVCEFYSFNSRSACSLFWDWSERKKEKLRAIMHYFKVVTDERKSLLNFLSLLFVRCIRVNL